VHTVAEFHAPLTEEYIWTANDAAVAMRKESLNQLKRDDWKVEPHFFRRSFRITARSEQATLYIAGPRHARVWINGVLTADLHFSAGHHMGFDVLTAEVNGKLRVGDNLIAIEAVRGYGSHHHTNSLKTSWLNSGEVLAVKLIPAAEGVGAVPVLISNNAWKSSVNAASGWQEETFDDAAWKPVVSLGSIESDVDFFQWNADGGMYALPDYLGEAPYMANYRIHAAKTEQRGDHHILLDFGREINGRIVLSTGTHAIHAHVIYGESMGELLHAPHLGEVTLSVPSHAEARGPKTGFRYALVSIDKPADGTDISAEGIYYPVTPIGSFVSNDARLNKIWETAVYTAHLSMQDSILDGIKRDRGRWIGDDEVINRVIADVYGDSRLVKAGLDDSLGPAPLKEHVNGLPGYSAWWIVAEAEYVRRWGDLRQFNDVKARMLTLLTRMERDLDERNVYAANGAKPWVDWAQDFTSDSPEARRAVHFEYLLAFRKAAWLLRIAGDESNAAKYDARADAMAEAAQKYLRDEKGGFGDRWQTNAVAVLSGVVTNDQQRTAVWSVLARTVSGRKPGDVITPYYGGYVLSAMAMLGHRSEALQWMNTYWGGMLDEGATSFWEAWDPAWHGDDPHAHLEADDKVGYNASLAHGWASGPAAWMMEELLGVTAVDAGFNHVQVRPELAGLEWVRGAVATPHGPVRVEASGRRVVVEVPAGVEAAVLLPAGEWTRSGVAVSATQDEAGARMRTVLQQPGKYEFVRR
jgi:hypothetical protein